MVALNFPVTQMQYQYDLAQANFLLSPKYFVQLHRFIVGEKHLHCSYSQGAEGAKVDNSGDKL